MYFVKLERATPYASDRKLMNVTSYTNTQYMFYCFSRTLSIWNQMNSHPLFAESDARFHASAVNKMRRLLYGVVIGTLLSVVGKENTILDKFKNTRYVIYIMEWF